MHFQCPRCARTHEFPAARMNAAGRVPCKCDATLVLEPPARQSRPLSSPDLENADIVRLGYRIRVESSPRPFDAIRSALRAAMAPRQPGDPPTAQAPFRTPPLLLAAGAAWNPSLFVAPAVLAVVVLELRWPLGWWLGSGPMTDIVAAATQTLAAGLLLALGAPAVAIALASELPEESAPWSTRAALRSMLSGAHAAIGSSALRSVLGPVLLSATLVMIAVAVDRIAVAGALPSPLRVAADPVVVLLLVGSVAAGVSVLLSALTHAALAPRADALLPVQIELGVRRIRGSARLLPGRPLAPAVASSILALCLLAGAVALLLSARPSEAAAAHADAAIGRQLGRDILVALAAGIWTAFVGAAGMVSDHRSEIVVARPPARAPEIITGTQKAMQAVMEAPLPGRSAAQISAVALEREMPASTTTELAEPSATSAAPDSASAESTGADSSAPGAAAPQARD